MQKKQKKRKRKIDPINFGKLLEFEKKKKKKKFKRSRNVFSQSLSPMTERRNQDQRRPSITAFTLSDNNFVSRQSTTLNSNLTSSMSTPHGRSYRQVSIPQQQQQRVIPPPPNQQGVNRRVQSENVASASEEEEDSDSEDSEEEEEEDIHSFLNQPMIQEEEIHIVEKNRREDHMISSRNQPMSQEEEIVEEKNNEEHDDEEEKEEILPHPPSIRSENREQQEQPMEVEFDVGEEIDIENHENQEVIRGFPEDILEKHFPNSCLSRKFPKEDNPSERNQQNHDNLTEEIEGKTNSERMKRSIEILKEKWDELLPLYGFCECCSRGKLNNIIRDLLKYKKIDLSCLEGEKYEKPIFESKIGSDENARFECPMKVFELALLYCCSYNSSKMSFEGASRTLIVWASILELSGFKVNFQTTFKHLVKGINETLDFRRRKVVFCVNCEDKIHVFFEMEDKKKKWNKKNIPICPHCFESVESVSIEERKSKSPFELRKGDIVPKDGHYILISNPIHFFNDIISQRKEVYDCIIGSQESDFLKTTHGEYMKKKINKEKILDTEHEHIAVFCDYRCDDVSSYNNCASSVSTGIQTLDLPQIKDYRKHFSNIVVSALSAADSKGWRVHVLKNYFLSRFLIHCIYNPSILSMFGKIHKLYYILNGKHQDLSDRFDGDRCKNTVCVDCRTEPTITKKKKMNQKTKKLYPSIKRDYSQDAGLERSVLTVLLGGKFGSDHKFCEYKRGMKGITPLVELCRVYYYDYLKSNLFDIQHRTINNISHLMKYIPKSLRTNMDNLFQRKVVFHGIPRLFRNMTAMGNYKYTEKLNFLSTFSTEILIIGDADVVTISLFAILRRGYRMLYSDSFNVEEWDNLYNLFKIQFRLKEKDSFSKAFHIFFVHLFKNMSTTATLQEGCLHFENILFKYLQEGGTEDGETYYTAFRKIVKRNFKFDSSAMRSLHTLNVLPLLVGELSDRIKTHPRLKTVVQNYINTGESGNGIFIPGNMYEGYIVKGGMAEFSPSQFKSSIEGKFSPTLKSLSEYIVSLLENYEGNGIDENQKNEIINQLKKILDRNDFVRNIDSLFPVTIQIMEFFKLVSPKNNFDFISMEYKRLKLENLNSHILYLYPVDELEDDNGEFQEFENDYFKYCGRILRFLHIKIFGISRVVCLVQQHKRLGFWHYERSKFATGILKLLEDVQVVESEGTSVHCVNVKQISKHLMMLKIQEKKKLLKISLFENSKDVRSKKENQTIVNSHEERSFRVVFVMNDKKKMSVVSSVMEDEE